MLNDPLEFTSHARGSFYRAVEDSYFYESGDARLIYEQLEKNLHAVPFCEYLKRYLYRKAGLTGDYPQIPLEEYRLILRESFRDTGTPFSFQPTSTRSSTLLKNWLTQQTVKRNVVFLLGFGLQMSEEDVNEFLVKALHEPEICFKDPFEVICWYCYKNHCGFSRFACLWNAYQELPAAPRTSRSRLEEPTIHFRNLFYRIWNDMELLACLKELKTDPYSSRFRVTARQHFDKLYAQTCQLIAAMYNKSEEERLEKEIEQYRDTLAMNQRLYNYEKLIRVEKRRGGKKHYQAEEITESDIEQVLYAAIPQDRYGNLSPSKISTLHAQFLGKRFHRQHIHEILTCKTEINRFDLITLQFFICSQKSEGTPDPKQRLMEFVYTTNAILEDCAMGRMYIANPYECFLMMCIMSEEPMGTFADVWEMSYQEGSAAEEESET